MIRRKLKVLELVVRFIILFGWFFSAGRGFWPTTLLLSMTSDWWQKMVSLSLQFGLLVIGGRRH